jgi:biopolymer transport protein ExbB
MKRWMRLVWMVAGFALFAADGQAQEAAAPAAAPAAAAQPEGGAAPAAEKAPPSGMNLWAVIISSGWLGILLWVGLALSSVAAAALIIDSFITVKGNKIAPPELVEQVREAMVQGDVMKAIKFCEERPTPLSNILTAGFSNVQEGFDVIQDVVGVAAELESEKLMQRVAYLNMCANIAPMLGLLGTVQGMIYAFANLATSQAGAAQQALLAMNIAQALWTTAVGLLVAIPAVSFYTYFKNRASNVILSMEGLTMDLIKSLRNVEVVEG